jgi:hypothetical protein
MVRVGRGQYKSLFLGKLLLAFDRLGGLIRHARERMRENLNICDFRGSSSSLAIRGERESVLGQSARLAEPDAESFGLSFRSCVHAITSARRKAVIRSAGSR